MEKIRLGKTDMYVTKLGFGGIAIQSVDQETAVDIVKYAFKQGINFYDTGRRYTTSEERIGIALETNRKDVLIATKVHLAELDELEKDIYESLNQLRTDYLDLFQFHNVTQDEIKQLLTDKKIMDFLKSFKKAGKIRYLGITAHRPKLLMEVIDSGLFDTIQIPFNYIQDESKDDVIPRALETGVGVIVMKPLSGGVFTNADAALKWVLQWDQILPIPGISNKQEIDLNIKSLYGKLTEQDIAQLEEDKITLKNNFCRGCNYCLPACPNNIKISNILRAKFTFDRTGWHKFGQKQIKMFESGLQCEQCGYCEQYCPYELPITKLVIEESKKMLQYAEDHQLK